MKRHIIDNEIEEKIVTGLIISDKICANLIMAIKLDYFQVEYVKIVVNWCINYYNSYKHAPDSNIENIFNFEKSKLNPTVSELISTFLKNLSLKHQQNIKFNVDFLTEKALEYFRYQAARELVDKVDILLDNRKIDDAEFEIKDYKKIVRNTSNWVNPFDEEYSSQIYNDNFDDDKLFTFPGRLGELTGTFERNWLVGILAPRKRGKTWWLQETGIQGVLEHCKVAFFSLEMNHKRVAKRIYNRITSTTDSELDIAYPVFDCRLNQLGICTSPLRQNRITLIRSEDEVPVFNANSPYDVCTACRNLNSNFKPAVWFKSYHRSRLKTGELVKSVSALKRMYGNNFRLISYPSFSANVQRIKRDLDNLEYLDGFIPDVIIIDYADILAPEDNRQTGRERSDDTWKMLKNLADERHCLVVTASQSNRASTNKKNLSQIDIADDIRKIGHVDLMFALNQSAIEKRMGVMRISIVGARDSDFDEEKQVAVLQQLKVGQVRLDSEYFYT